MLLLLSAIVGALLAFVIWQNFAEIREYTRWRILISKLPVAPEWIFFLGHLHKLIGLSNVEFWNICMEFYPKAPPVHTVYLGPALVYVTILDAEVTEAVISSMKNLPKAKIYGFLNDWLEDGLLTSAGNHWQTRRKILTPAFHFSILQEFIEIFTRETAKMTKEIEENYLDKPVNVIPLISNFTLLTINETSMGKLDLNTKDGISYRDAIYTMGDVLYKRMMKPWLHYKIVFDKTSLGKEANRLITTMQNFTNNIIRKREETFKPFEVDLTDDGQFPKKKVKRPLLDILLNAKLKDNSIDVKGIREEVNTFMFEGHDTTASGLSFACMLLACHRKVQDEIYQEIIQILGTDLNREPTYTDLQDMTFLERCIKECLRLYTPVPLIGRQLDSDVPTEYGIIPKGSNCIIQIFHIHRNKKYWTNPNEFDPSRHLPENSRERHPFAYMPFSAGPRNCIGQRFAMLELKSAICGLIRKFILEPIDSPETVVLMQDMVLRPRDGIKVKFVLRTS